MFKTFLLGIVLGLVASAGALYLVPIVNQDREASIISVSPNGGNTESFHINLPADRILLAGPGVREAAAAVPPGVQWPDATYLAGTQIELFKFRNARDTVVGIASHVVATGTPESNDAELKTGSDRINQWVLHLPARGSVYLQMQPAAVAEGQSQIYRREGVMLAGTREFRTLTGTVVERQIDKASTKDTSAGAPSGRIEIVLNSKAAVLAAGEQP